MPDEVSHWRTKNGERNVTIRYSFCVLVASLVKRATVTIFVTVWLSPFDPWVNACRATAIEYMCTKFGVDSSSRFPFRARTNRQTDNKQTDRRLNAIPTPAAIQPAWVITAFWRNKQHVTIMLKSLHRFPRNVLTFTDTDSTKSNWKYLTYRICLWLLSFSFQLGLSRLK